MMLGTILDSRSGIADALLLEIARRIQLSPTNYRLAVERYQTISDYLDREGSPLHGLVTRLYPQGSMAIGSVITSKFENDEFDIDIVAELGIHPDTPPSMVLDTLFNTLNGEKDSRYYGKVERCSRCVKVQYEGMHLDVTPSVLLPFKPERTSFIFHANETEPASKHHTVTANPWGFAEWFKEQMPESALLMEELSKYAADPVPKLEPHFTKSKPLIALQLLKRWRNKIYDKRDGRMPPSVMLSCLVGHNTGYRVSLLDELVAQSQYLLNYFSAHTEQGVLVEVKNPACLGEDVFTDRWPKNLATQRVFTDDLRTLNGKLAELSKDKSLECYQRIMADLFGEKPTTLALEEIAKSFSTKAHSGGLYHYPKSGAIALGASGIATGLGNGTSYATPKNTFYGSD